MQPDSIGALALQPVLPSPIAITSPRQARMLSAPSTSSPEYTAALAVLTSQAPPLASLPESSDSLPGDFMKQPEPPESPLRHFLPRASKTGSPSALSKASRRLGTQLDASTQEGRAVREDSAQQVLPPFAATYNTLYCIEVTSALQSLVLSPFPPSPPRTNTHDLRLVSTNSQSAVPLQRMHTSAELLGLLLCRSGVPMLHPRDIRTAWASWNVVKALSRERCVVQRLPAASTHARIFGCCRLACRPYKSHQRTYQSIRMTKP